MQRIAVFASGRGSNFLALLEAEKEKLFPGRIVLLLSDQQDAGAIELAREHDLPVFVLPPGRGKGRLSEAEEISLRDACQLSGVQWICLAGFMRILRGPLLEAYPDRILNIHPSLLPSFPGLHAQKQAWEFGVKVAGCSVHFVDQGVDSGPLVLQKEVRVREGESSGDLSARILAEEHQLYAEALRRLFTDPWERRDRRIVFTERERKS
ncbi:MAG: phosphoribosylglycinamide formyltransferase [Candidatus Krumholzibacteria bacterium]|jgi:phosphoribosylglycinamide formyltransferase-1|nr:phosphoribosylglycinamide formyltransferase [Candidatus Krumholzibacteria bacterium]MDP6796600.1 phosphoribosylglycinamide formyltransferase [Candidatus Krumholzibacteria bacterium]MDP7020926.1 phosphoribosylglycinamide formyltransferase [Candidatus Krumholzibacteria bacterium]